LPDGTVVAPDGVFEIADAWQQPLRFYRWPTRLVNGNVPQDMTWDGNAARKTLMQDAPASNADPSKEIDLKVDPDDRAGYISAPHPLYKVPLVAFFHDPTTWHAPLVVSAGADGVLGIAEPGDAVTLIPSFPLPGLAAPLTTPADQEGLFDNLTNHNASGGF
jgi:hypothetical protein